MAKKENSSVEEFMEIGGSPVPGITLRQVLRGHTDVITRIAWSPDGHYLASPSEDKTIRLWNINTGDCIALFEGHKERIHKVAWSPNGNYLASSCGSGFPESTENTVQIWDVKTRQSLAVLAGHEDAVYDVGWSPDGSKLASASYDKTIRIWDTESKSLISILKGHSGGVTVTAWSPNGQVIASGSDDKTIRLWKPSTGVEYAILKGHHGPVTAIVWSPNGEILVTGAASDDSTIRVWDVRSLEQKNIIEGHTLQIWRLSFSADGQLLASKSADNTVRIWQLGTWQELAKLYEQGAWGSNSKMGKWNNHPSVTFHPYLPKLATLGEYDKIVRIWDIDLGILLGSTSTTKSVSYTTAKLVLVGDSGVGKTGLGWRLAHNEFKEHSSTHGQQFWVVPELKKTRENGTECEAVLWDLAGQHIYRSIHSIFLDDVDASLVLFDPTNRQEPLKGAQFWLEQLKGKKQLPPSVLVGARLDRGAPVLSQQELNQFCQKYGVSGGYIGTSAKSGEGLDTLLETLKSQILWDQMTTTVTTVTFKKIKDYVLTLKEKPDRKGVLVRPEELRKQLEVTDKDWQFTDAEMMTAVGHVANHGYVTILHSSSGEEYILLIPELLASVAASIFLHADKHPRELGAINETELLQGKYPIDEFKGLETEEQQVLLDATVVRFLEHSICFRETLGNDTLLIFPSLIKQKRPLQDEFESNDDVSYILRGRVENIYASLVVLLGYTTMFTRINQWQNQAQYEMGVGEVSGFRLIEEREDELELVLYYSKAMPSYGRTLFQGLFESFLYKHDVEVTRFPPVKCPKGHRQERATVIKRVREGKEFIFCEECGEKTILPEIEIPERLGTKETRQVQFEDALAKLRATYEAYLTRVKGFRRDRSAARCYISHAGDYSEWVANLIHDLRDAGVMVIEDVALVKQNDFILQVCTPAYKDAWDKSIGRLHEDANLIRARLQQSNILYPTVIPIRREGKSYSAIPNELVSLFMADFRADTLYSVSLFDLVMSLYAIPLNHEAFRPFRQALHNQWEQTLAHSIKSKHELFISYAWGKEDEEREAIVNDLDKVFQGRGVTIIRDKRDLGFKGRIKEFMETIGQGKAVILVISEKYLKSPNCCFESVQIAKHGDFADRVFPIVLDDAKIYDPIDRGRYVKHWESKKNELETFMKEVSAANLDGFREDIDLYTEIRTLLPRLMDVLKDMNTLSSEMHRQSDFSEIFDAIMAKLEE